MCCKAKQRMTHTRATLNLLTFRDKIIMTSVIIWNLEIEFGNLYKRMWDFEMKLQDVVLTFKLLDGAKGIIIIIIFTFTHNRKRFF